MLIAAGANAAMSCGPTVLQCDRLLSAELLPAAVPFPLLRAVINTAGVEASKWIVTADTLRLDQR